MKSIKNIAVPKVQMKKIDFYIANMCFIDTNMLTVCCNVITTSHFRNKKNC